MGLKSLVQKNVRKAFDRIGDLAVTVTLVKKNTTGFNFSTLSATQSTPVTYSLKGVMVEKTKNINTENATNTNRLSVMMIAEDMEAFGEFDTLTINGVSYVPERPFKNNGYTVEITIARGV